MLSIIAAKAKNNIIGKDNKLIWNISDDLKRFKKLTEHHTIIMGRKTFESLGRVLPNRKHVVFTHNLDFDVDNENADEECFVIGGGLIYTLLMPYANKMYITEIDKEFEGDTLFPIIKEAEWKEVKRTLGPSNENIPYKYEYVTYVRK